MRGDGREMGGGREEGRGKGQLRVVGWKEGGWVMGKRQRKGQVAGRPASGQM